MNFLHKTILDIEIEDKNIYLIKLVSQLNSLSQKYIDRKLKNFPKQFFFFRFIKKEILLNYSFLFIKKKSNILLNYIFRNSSSQNQKNFFGFLIKIYTKSPFYLRFILKTFFSGKNFVFSLNFLTSAFRNVHFRIVSPVFIIWSFFICVERKHIFDAFFYDIDMLRTMNCQFCPLIRIGKYQNKEFFGKILFKLLSLIIINHRKKVICREQKYNLFKISLKGLIGFTQVKKQWLNISFMNSQDDKHCNKFFSIDNFIFFSFQLKKLEYIKNLKINFFCFSEKKIDVFYRLKSYFFSNKQFFKYKKQKNLKIYKFNGKFYGIYFEKILFEKHFFFYINLQKRSCSSFFKKQICNSCKKPQNLLLVNIKIYSEKIKNIKPKKNFSFYIFSFFFNNKIIKIIKIGKKLTLYDLTSDMLLVGHANITSFFLNLHKINKRSFTLNFLGNMRKFLKFLKKLYKNFDLWNFIKIIFLLN